MPEDKITETFADRGLRVHRVANAAEALQHLKQLIPAQAAVMYGSSETLKEIGFVDYLKNGNPSWRNLKGEIQAEDDSDRREELRRQASLADFYLGSVHAVARTGQTADQGLQRLGLATGHCDLCFALGEGFGDRSAQPPRCARQ